MAEEHKIYSLNTSEPVCYICGNMENKIRSEKLRYGIEKKVIECGKCGFVYLWPREDNTETIDFYAQGFRNLPRSKLGLAEHDPDDIFQSRLGQARRRFNMVRPYLDPEQSSLLEIGSAAGSFLSLVKPVVKKCSAIELDPVFASYIRKNLNVDVIEKPVEMMKRGDGPFDIICMWHVLEHLYDPVEVLKHLKDLLSDSGYLFLEVPNIFDPLITIYRLSAFKSFYYQSPHLYYFSPPTLNKVLTMAGWEAEIFPVQIYGIINHLRWLYFQRPQSHQPKKGTGIFQIFERMYKFIFEKLRRTDTLFAIARKIK